MAISTLSFRSYVSKLSGRRLGAFKTAAAKLGISFDDYIDRIEQGQKNCIDCRQWKDRGDFYVDMSRWDGLASKCAACSSRRGVEGYDPVDPSEQKAMGPARQRCVGGDKEHARALINMDVKTGRRPNPNDLFCVKCGHKGGDVRHEYHHHMGYGPEHVYDVVPLCSTCHHGEHECSEPPSSGPRAPAQTAS